MGTHIHCLFARDADSDPVTIQALLDELSKEHREDLRVLAERGRFSQGCGGWHVALDRPGGGEPESLVGEGPAGLGIAIFRRVGLVSSAERFAAIVDPRYGVAVPLRRLLGLMAEVLGTSPRVAVAAGGMGDTDRAVDLAYYAGASFEEVIGCLAEVAGPPADSWSELDLWDRQWYFGRLQCES